MSPWNSMSILRSIVRDRGRTHLMSSWRSLFHFMTWRDIPTLTIAIILTVMAGMVMPAFVILLGILFDAFTNFGSTTISSLQLIEETAKGCKALLGLGIGSLILNGMYLALWVIFGELQATNIRSRLFSELLGKDLKWFDMQQGGIGALISRLQMYITDLHSVTLL